MTDALTRFLWRCSFDDAQSEVEPQSEEDYIPDTTESEAEEVQETSADTSPSKAGEWQGQVQVMPQDWVEVQL